MSNNIYDILKKMQSLETPKANLTESKGSKPDFLDMDKDGDTTEPMKKAAKAKSKGAVAEAVAQVERQLNEKYQGFKKAAATDKKMVKELDPNLKDPESEWFHSRGQIAPVAAWDNDEQGQKQYKDRTAPGVINKVKDFVGYDKPNPAYGPRDTKVKEGDYNEDMLSPGQKKIARMSPPPNKIDANDLKALRAGKDKKKEGMFDDAADRAIANVNARTSREVNDEFRRSNLNPSMKSPNTDKFKTDIEQSRARGDKFYDTPEKFHQGPFSGQTPANILSKDAEERDIEGQNKYRDRTSPGIINKAKDFIGYDKPDSAYGPKDTKVKEGFPTVADAKKRMDDRDGKTAHGKKTITKTGTRHERDYDAVDKGADVDMTPKGRGRPKKDRFA